MVNLLLVYSFYILEKGSGTVKEQKGTLKN